MSSKPLPSSDTVVDIDSRLHMLPKAAHPAHLAHMHASINKCVWPGYRPRILTPQNISWKKTNKSDTKDDSESGSGGRSRGVRNEQRSSRGKINGAERSSGKGQTGDAGAGPSPPSSSAAAAASSLSSPPSSTTAAAAAGALPSQQDKEVVHPFLVFALLLPNHPYSLQLKQTLNIVAPLYGNITTIIGDALEFSDFCNEYHVKSFPKILFFKQGFLVDMMRIPVPAYPRQLSLNGFYDWISTVFTNSCSYVFLLPGRCDQNQKAMFSISKLIMSDIFETALRIYKSIVSASGQRSLGGAHTDPSTSILSQNFSGGENFSGGGYTPEIVATEYTRISQLYPDAIPTPIELIQMQWSGKQQDLSPVYGESGVIPLTVTRNLGALKRHNITVPESKNASTSTGASATSPTSNKSSTGILIVDSLAEFIISRTNEYLDWICAVTLSLQQNTYLMEPVASLHAHPPAMFRRKGKGARGAKGERGKEKAKETEGVGAIAQAATNSALSAANAADTSSAGIDTTAAADSSSSTSTSSSNSYVNSKNNASHKITLLSYDTYLFLASGAYVLARLIGKLWYA